MTPWSWVRGRAAGWRRGRWRASGRSVLLVERGDYPDTDHLARDHLRNARTDSGLDHRTLRSSAQNPRTVLLDADPVVLPAWDPRYGSNADTFGGGTRVYGAQAWRFVPEDFAMATTYGVPDGSALADWPIDYDDLEPFYTQAEYEIGVCGSDAPHAGSSRRSRPYPMAPMAITAPARRLLAGAQRSGWSTVPVPLAINSAPCDGRAGVRPMPPVRGLRLPGRGQEQLGEHRARAGRRDREPQHPARDPRRAHSSPTPPDVSSASISSATTAAPAGVVRCSPRTWSSRPGRWSRPGSC